MPIPIFCKIDMLRSIHSASRGGKIERLRHEQFLRRDPLLFHSAPQFFEQDSLVRRVLIDQHEPVRVFHQDIKFVEHADDLELLLTTRLPFDHSWGTGLCPVRRVNGSWKRLGRHGGRPSNCRKLRQFAMRFFRSTDLRSER